MKIALEMYVNRSGLSVSEIYSGIIEFLVSNNKTEVCLAPEVANFNFGQTLTSERLKYSTRWDSDESQ